MTQMPYDMDRPTSSKERDLSLTDANRLFMELGNAVSHDKLYTLADHESLVQNLLYVISSHEQNQHQIADEIQSWREEVPFDFTARLQELGNLVEHLAGGDKQLTDAVNEHFRAFYIYVKRLHSEIRSVYHPSRYQITYYEDGIPHPIAPLRIIQVLEGVESRINLHINKSNPA